MTEYIENPLSGKLRGVTYENGKIIEVHIRDTDDVVKVFVPVRHGRWKAYSDCGVTVQEWISVEDRLPENGVHVLLCCETHRYGGEIAGKYVCDGYYAEANKIIAGGFPDECNCEYSEEDDEYYLCEGWYEVIKNCDGYDSVPVEDFVTHWMPLPEPPDMKKTEE